MQEEKLRSGRCLCGRSRYQTKGDSSRAIMCHCRYCQTFTGSAFGTQVWFPEDMVTLISEELSEYENNTGSGNEVKLNFCKNCGSTIFLRLNVFQGMAAIPRGSFDPRTFWFEPQVENFCRTKAPFIQTSTAEKHDTHPMYKPKTPDNHPVIKRLSPLGFSEIKKLRSEF